MLVINLQIGLIKLCIASKASRLTIFFSNSDRDFNSENNNVSQGYTYIPKIQRKSKEKNTIIFYAQTQNILIV
jgi:hypothetical protein